MYTILSNGLVRVNLTCYITMSEYKELIAGV